ncbi:MAG: ATP-binding cassette domain-containing protein, partial [Porphyromonadaceae bacterium]|nr:ATP-binding cassette domain-containing protein [Porphyromonadaceae bacterium]
MTKKILTLEDASIGYPDTLVLDGLNWTVCRGERWAITGPNGCGKTTLMRTLLGLLPLRAGRLTRYDREEAPTQGLVMSYLPQINQIDRHFPIHVEEIIASGLPQGLEKHRRLAEVERLAEVFGITTLLRQPLGRLSGGQLQRTLLARSLASDPELLILDEPLSFL